MAIFPGAKKEANFEQLWVNFGPIYAQKMAIFSRQKKEANFEQFLANLFQKMPIFFGKKHGGEF